MYPVKLMPPVLKLCSRINPLTYGVDALKHLVFPLETGHMSADFPLYLDVSVIIAVSILFVIIGGKAFERKG
jgi:ABC-type polysaccharide/polyol phosphate export permease